MQTNQYSYSPLVEGKIPLIKILHLLASEHTEINAKAIRKPSFLLDRFQNTKDAMKTSALVDIRIPKYGKEIILYFTFPAARH